MEKVIYKYEFRNEYKDNFATEIPAEAQIVKYGMQGNQFYLWAIVDNTEEEDIKEKYFRVLIIPTGYVIPEGCKYLDTVFNTDKSLVFHILEEE